MYDRLRERWHVDNVPVAGGGEGEEEREITAPLDVRSLQEGWARKEARAPQWHIRLTCGAKTDLGRVRENNEDKFDSLEPEDATILAARGRLYAVADGMGGHAAGQIASELALKSVIREYYANTGDGLEAALTAAVQAANSLVHDTARAIPGRSGMGTTLTAAVIHENRLVAAQVGDSRLYLLREGAIRQVTEDHSWVAEQVRLGALDAASAARSPFRNVITRSLGAEAEVRVDLFEEELRPGDRLLLCSDGLSGQVPDERMASLAGKDTPSVACLELIDAANDSGGRDNITVLLLRVDSIEPFASGGSAARLAAQPPQELTAQPPQELSARPTEAEPAEPAGWLSRLRGKR